MTVDCHILQNEITSLVQNIENKITLDTISCGHAVTITLVQYNHSKGTRESVVQKVENEHIINLCKMTII